MTLRPGIDQAASSQGVRTGGLFGFGVLTILAAGLGLALSSSLNLGLLAFEPRVEPLSIPSRTIAGGALVIHGGGRISQEIRTRFIELAGGPNARILVVPTAQADADTPKVERLIELWRPQPVASVAIFHTRSREKADDPEFIRPLREATGVWFTGGFQAAISDAYLGTAVERELKVLLARGGVIGGTSAGAAVMGRVMIKGGKTEARVGEGFGFLPDAVVDQHFLKRNRLGRLEGVIRDRAGLIGLGIDEGTALVVSIKDQRIRVLGDSYVVAVLPETKDGKVTTRSESLKAGDEADLTKLKALSPAAVVSAVDLDAL